MTKTKPVRVPIPLIPKVLKMRQEYEELEAKAIAQAKLSTQCSVTQSVA